jgi:hypothetical protein
MTVTKKGPEEGEGGVVTGSSEDLLKKLGPITIELENHQKVALSAASELRIPDGPNAILAAQRTAPARYAFWAYQAEIQNGRVRALQRKLEMKEGQGDLTFRKYICMECEWDVTEGGVKALKDVDATIGGLRVALNRARKEYGILRAMKEALNHRCFALDRLVARMSDVQKG